MPSTPRLTDERLAAIRGRVAALPAGQWSADTGLPYNVVSTGTTGWTPAREYWQGEDEEQQALDAEARFMAAAPTDLTALLAEVEALRAERDALAEKYEVTVTEWQHAKAAHGESERSGRALLLHLIGMDPAEFRQMKEDAGRWRFVRDNPLGLRAIDGNAGVWFPAALDSSVDHAMTQEATRA